MALLVMYVSCYLKLSFSNDNYKLVFVSRSYGWWYNGCVRSGRRLHTDHVPAEWAGLLAVPSQRPVRRGCGEQHHFVHTQVTIYTTTDPANFVPPILTEFFFWYTVASVVHNCKKYNHSDFLVILLINLVLTVLKKESSNLAQTIRSYARSYIFLYNTTMSLL